MKKGIYILLSLTFLLLFLEFGLRLSGRLKTYSEKNFGVYQTAYDASGEKHVHTWNKNDSIYSVQTEFDFSYLTNQYGLLKTHNYVTTSKDSSFVFIGDSFVFGVGANQDSSICSTLERKLPYTFLNAGIPGSDPFYEKVLIDSVFYPLGYKKYIFMVNFSDFYDYIFRGGAERFLPNNQVQYRQAPKIEWYYEKSLLLRAITHTILQRDFSLQTKKQTKLLKEQAVNDFAKLFTSLPKDVDVVVVFQPYASQFTSNNSITTEILNYAYLESLEKKLIANKVKTINLDSKLNAVINSENYLEYSWKLDGHYNAKGYELLGTVIIEELKKSHPEFLNSKTEN